MGNTSNKMGLDFLKSKKRGLLYLVFLIFFSLMAVLCPIGVLSKNKNEKNRIKTSTRVEEKEDKSSLLKNEGDDKTQEAADNDSDKNSTKKEDLDSGKGDEKPDVYKFEKPSVEEESYAWLIFKTIVILGVLIGAFYYFFRFVTKKTGFQVLGRDVVHVLSVLPLGQNKFLHVIDMAGRILVLGVTDNNINLITEVSNKDEADRIRLLSSKSTPAEPGGFQQYISKQMGKIFDRYKDKFEKNKSGNAESTSAADNFEYLRKHRERLNNLNDLDKKI